MKSIGSIEKIRQCFNESIFSTQISSGSFLKENQSLTSKHMTKISSKFTDQPSLYLKKVKLKKKQLSKKCLDALRQTVQAQMNLNKTERDASVSRYDFIKLYTAKKFKLQEKGKLSSQRVDQQMNMRLSLQKVRNQYTLNRLNITARKEQTLRDCENLYEMNKTHRSMFRDSLRESQEREKKIIEESAQKIKKERRNFVIRRKNLTDLMTTKSKFNYLSKINEQMQAIKDYQQLFDMIERKDNLELKSEAHTTFMRTSGQHFY